MELVQYREPRKRFLEKLQRETTAHGRIFYCELAEVRLASEEILSKPSFTPTADQLLKLTRTDVPVAISGEEDAMNRLNALLIAYEFPGLMGYSRSRQIEGVWTGGGIDYYIAVNQRRQKNPRHALHCHRRCTFPQEGPRGAEGKATGVSQSFGCFRLYPQGAQRLLE